MVRRLRKLITMHPTKRKALYASLALAGAWPLVGQEATPAPAATTPKTPSEEEVVVLSPFEVTTSQDTGYVATSTLAGTRIRTDLKDVGSSISVVTDQFLKDTGATSNETLLQYTTNTEVGGASGNFAGGSMARQGFADESQARLAPNQNTRVRGLASADNSRNFFLTNIPWDSYNTSRVDLQRGPNSLLFGMGSPAGIINADPDGAMLGTNNGTVEVRYGEYGSYRGSVNVNRVLLEDELALRVAVLDNMKHYRQRPAMNHDQRAYGAFRWDPKFLHFGSIARTSLKASYEKGDIDAIRPRTAALIDCYTPWFTSMNQQGYNPQTVNINNATMIAGDTTGTMGAFNAALNTGAANPNYQPWIQAAGELYNGALAEVFTDPNANIAPYGITSGAWTYQGLNSSGQRDGSIAGITQYSYTGIQPYNEYKNTKLIAVVGATLDPAARIGAYRAKSITDTSIFDFYNNLIDGPNSRNYNRFEAFNAELTQSFFNDTLAFSFQYDKQNYRDGGWSNFSRYALALSVDINQYLCNGALNPNFGRPMLVGAVGGGSKNLNNSESYRGTAYYEFKFRDILPEKNGWLARLLGTHRFSGTMQELDNRRESLNYTRATLSQSDSDYNRGYSSGTSSLSISESGRLVSMISYLGDSQYGHALGDVPITGLQVLQTPASTIGSFMYDSTPRSGTAAIAGNVWSGAPLFVSSSGNSTQSENPANYTGWTYKTMKVNTDELYKKDSCNTTKYELNAWAASWQAYFLDNNLVTTYGYRHDKFQSWTGSYAAGADTNQADLSVAPTYTKDTPVTNNSKTYSAVLHTPRFIREKLPLGLGLSLFWDQSENFQPATRVDVYADPIAPPKGKTIDKGFLISAWDDRISFKVTKYKTQMSNASMAGWGNSWMIANEYNWGYTAARAVINGTRTSTDSVVQANQMAAAQAWLAGTNPSEHFLSAYGISTNGGTGALPGTFAVTGSYESKGTEYELNVRPTSNWDIAINASHTDAKQFNLAGSMAAYVEDRWALLNTVAGDLGAFSMASNPSTNSGTLRAWYARKVWNQYCLYRATEGNSTPELRPWRFNLVTTYRFKDGFLKGFYVGGGYRWEDKQVVGYKVTDLDGDTYGSYDISQPYYSPTEDHFDGWIGYGRKITSKVDWRIQLNVRNIAENPHLIPISVQPDGSEGEYRIADGMTWEISNTFKF